MTRTFIKVARKAEYDGGYTTLTEVAGGTPSGDGTQGEKGEKGEKGDKGDKGDQGEPGLPGADAVVDPSELNLEFNTDQIELVDSNGNFCGLHVKGIHGITVDEDTVYGNTSMVISGTEGLEARVIEGEGKQNDIEGTIASALQEQEAIQNKLLNLEITKGTAAVYRCSGIGPTNVRPGEIAFDTRCLLYTSPRPRDQT